MTNQKKKPRLGAKWDSFAGRMFRYFMVFQSKQRIIQVHIHMTDLSK